MLLRTLLGACGASHKKYELAAGPPAANSYFLYIQEGWGGNARFALIFQNEG